MTRINVVSPSELSRQMLIAEYREITRLPNNLKKSLSRSKPFNLAEIPNEYVLGKGHVKFFYNKFQFLKTRFESLVAEMISRGYKPNFTDSNIFIPDNEAFFGSYEPTLEAIEINRQRIKERSNVEKV